MPQSNPPEFGHLRKAGLELCHELKNQLGVAVGSVDLVRDDVADDLARADMDRALRALSELDRLITEAQSALRGGTAPAESLDLVAAVHTVLNQRSQIPGASDREIRHRLPDQPVMISYPPEALSELLGRLLTGTTDQAVDLLLQAELSEPDPKLPEGRFCCLLTRGGRTRVLEEGWSFEAERFRVRTLGGDLRLAGGGLLLLLPLAVA